MEGANCAAEPGRAVQDVSRTLPVKRPELVGEVLTHSPLSCACVCGTFFEQFFRVSSS